jgi:hypothetical protein
MLQKSYHVLYKLGITQSALDSDTITILLCCVLQSYVDINLQEAKKKTQAASMYREDLLQPVSRV